MILFGPRRAKGDPPALQPRGVPSVVGRLLAKSLELWQRFEIACPSESLKGLGSLAILEPRIRLRTFFVPDKTSGC